MFKAMFHALKTNKTLKLEIIVYIKNYMYNFKFEKPINFYLLQMNFKSNKHENFKITK